MNTQPLFEVHGPEGQKWELYENGNTVGFPKGSLVINRANMALNALRVPVVKIDSTLVSDEKS